MARPRVRTAALPAGDAAQLRKLFGTSTNAYQQLMPGGAPLTWHVFRIVAAGRPCKPSDLDAFRASLQSWKRANLRA